MNPKIHGMGLLALTLIVGLLPGCIDDGGEAGFYNEQGIDLLAKDDYEQARLSFEEAIKRNPNDGIVWGNLGVTLTRLERLDEALDAYAKSEKLVPGDPITAVEVGGILYRMKRYKDAEARYRDAITLEPRAAEFHSSLALTLLRQGKQQAADAAMKKAVMLGKARPLVAYQQAAYLLVSGKVAAGLEAFEQSLAAYPDGRRASVSDADFDVLHGDDRYQRLVKDWWKSAPGH